jgi:hypothetical protein
VLIFIENVKMDVRLVMAVEILLITVLLVNLAITNGQVLVGVELIALPMQYQRVDIT